MRRSSRPGQHYAVETARPEDLRDRGDRRRHVPEQSALTRAWGMRSRAFRVARSTRGQVVAFTILCELSQVPAAVLRDPVRPGVAISGRIRCRADSESWGNGSRSPRHLNRAVAVSGALLRDMERASLEAGPAVRRIYSGARGEDDARPACAGGFTALADVYDVELGDETYQAIVWTSARVGGRVAFGLASRDLPIEGTVLERDAPQLSLEGAASHSEARVRRPALPRDREGQTARAPRSSGCVG